MGGRTTANWIDFGPGPPATEKSPRPLAGPLRAMNRYVQSGSGPGEPAAKRVELDALGLNRSGVWSESRRPKRSRTKASAGSRSVAPVAASDVGANRALEESWSTQTLGEGSRGAVRVGARGCQPVRPPTQPLQRDPGRVGRSWRRGALPAGIAHGCPLGQTDGHAGGRGGCAAAPVAVPDVPGRQLRPARLADRPRPAGWQVPAAGPGPRAVAARAGRTWPRRRTTRHWSRSGRRSAPDSTSSPTARSAGRATPTTSPRPSTASTSTTPVRPWTAAAIRTRCRGWSDRSRRPAPVQVRDTRVPAGQHRPHHQGHRPRAVHDVAAGSERLLPRHRVAGDGVRRGVQRGGQGPLRGRRRHRAARRAVPAGPAGGRPRVRGRGAEPGAGRA